MGEDPGATLRARRPDRHRIRVVPDGLHGTGGRRLAAMTTTPPEAPADAPQGPGPDPYHGGPRASGEEIRDLGRLRRTIGPDRRIAGVAGGVARHLDIDPVILRVAFVVLVFFGGAGLILYVACWLLVPQDGSESAPLRLDERSRSVALIGIGVLAVLALLGDSLGQLEFPWMLVVIALITLIVLTSLDRRRDHPRPTAPPVPHQQGDSGELVPTSSYSAAVAAPGSTVPPRHAQPSYLPADRVPNPRRRGPILFWFTLALSALGIGVLGIVDLAGAPVADSAYPALVVAACGVMLLVGAFFGRAGGLILVGLLAALGMVGATASDHWDQHNVLRPTTAAQVDERYEMGAGELTLDLTGVSDLEALDGRVVRMEAGAGRIEVVVPEGVDVDVDARAGLGNIILFGEELDGAGIETSGSHDGGTDVPEVTLDIQVGMGEIDVHAEEPPAGPAEPAEPADPVTPGAPQ